MKKILLIDGHSFLFWAFLPLWKWAIEKKLLQQFSLWSKCFTLFWPKTRRWIASARKITNKKNFFVDVLFSDHDLLQIVSPKTNLLIP